MKVYVEAQSKAALIRRLDAGEEITGLNYSMFGGGGYYKLDDTLEDGTIIAIYSQMSGGNPVAKSWGTWTNGVLKAESFDSEEEKVIKNCQRCGGKAKMTWVQAKCSDLYNQVNLNTGKEYDGYVPDWIGIYGDYVIFTICRHCGQVQGGWPELDATMNQFKSGKANTSDIFEAEAETFEAFDPADAWDNHIHQQEMALEAYQEYLDYSGENPLMTLEEWMEWQADLEDEYLEQQWKDMQEEDEPSPEDDPEYTTLEGTLDSETFESKSSPYWHELPKWDDVALFPCEYILPHGGELRRCRRDATTQKHWGNFCNKHQWKSDVMGHRIKQRMFEQQEKEKQEEMARRDRMTKEDFFQDIFESPVSCKICGKTFASFRGLNGHMNAHLPSHRKRAETFEAELSEWLPYEIITTDWKSSIKPEDRPNNDNWFITGDIIFAVPDHEGYYGRGNETIVRISTYGEGTTLDEAKENGIQKSIRYLYEDYTDYVQNDCYICGAGDGPACDSDGCQDKHQSYRMDNMEAETFEAEYAPSVDGMIENPAAYYSCWQGFCEYIGVTTAHMAWRMVEKPWKWRPGLERWVNDPEWFTQEAETFEAPYAFNDDRCDNCERSLIDEQDMIRLPIYIDDSEYQVCELCYGELIDTSNDFGQIYVSDPDEIPESYSAEGDEPTIEDFFVDMSDLLTTYSGGDWDWDSEARDGVLGFSGNLTPTNGENFYQYDLDFDEIRQDETFEARGTSGWQVTCSKCGAKGHNKSTCGRPKPKTPKPRATKSKGYVRKTIDKDHARRRALIEVIVGIGAGIFIGRNL